MRLAWVGLHPEGVQALEALLEAGAPVGAVFTLRADLAAGRPGPERYRALAERYGLSFHRIANLNDPEARRILARVEPDVVFVIGWPQMVGPETLELAAVGMIGAHASLLPRHQGAAPINWALIRGDRETGSTLYWLTPVGRPGEIIDQVAIEITTYDTAATLYRKVAAVNREMLLRLLPRLLAGERPARPGPPPDDEPILPRRRAAHGRIDWDCPDRSVYNFVRALTRPFPGAFSWLGGRRWTVWHAALLPPVAPGVAPGTVLGPVQSPVDGACGQLVACGAGAIALLELESADGISLSGPPLSDQPWTGLRWGHE